MGKRVRTLVLAVKNRRMKVENEQDGSWDKEHAVHSGILWKLKADGDRLNEADWFERDMWLAQNGNFVYWSKKEERPLVYYTTADVSRATLVRIPNAQSFRPHVFQATIPPSADGIEFAPGEFAAKSEEECERWL